MVTGVQTCALPIWQQQPGMQRGALLAGSLTQDLTKGLAILVVDEHRLVVVAAQQDNIFSYLEATGLTVPPERSNSFMSLFSSRASLNALICLEIGVFATNRIEIIIAAKAKIISPGRPINLTRMLASSIPTAPALFPLTPPL